MEFEGESAPDSGWPSLHRSSRGIPRAGVCVCLVLRAVWLTSGLSDANFVSFGEVPKFVHPRMLSVKMSWNDDAGFRRELRFNFCRVEVGPVVFHVSKSWLCPCVDYGVGCGEE